MLLSDYDRMLQVLKFYGKIITSLPGFFTIDKNSAEVDIAPAFGAITTACKVSSS